MKVLYEMLHKTKVGGTLYGPGEYGDSMRIVGMQIWTNGTRGVQETDQSLESEDGEDVKATKRDEVQE